MVNGRTVTSEGTVPGGSQSKTMCVIQESNCHTSHMAYIYQPNQLKRSPACNRINKAGKILTSPEAIIWQKSSNLQILKFSFFRGPAAGTSRKQENIFLMTLHCFGKLFRRCKSNALLAERGKTIFFAPVIM